MDNEMMQNDTIAAISTGMTNSGIGIVRISGSEALSIVDQIFVMKNKKRLSEMPTHTIHYGHIYDGKELIDEVMVLLMKGPKSYTKEDTIEIDCHGGVYVVKRVLETVLKYGCVSGVVPALMYYKDTEEFFDRHVDEILDLLNELKEYGEISFELNRNNLAWFAFEETLNRIYNDLF